VLDHRRWGNGAYSRSRSGSPRADAPDPEGDAMATVLGVNAVFHDSAAAVLVDGEIVAAAEEERFSRRKHGKAPVPFSTWELPERSIRWCLDHAGVAAADVDAVAYSFDPNLSPEVDGDLTAQEWEGLRTLYAQRAPLFLSTVLPGLDRGRVRFVPHHVSHAASAWGPSPFESCAVLVLDGRGERGSGLGGHATADGFEVLWHQDLPHSLGLRYEELTAHLGFRRSSDEYKVMAMASYGRPRHLEAFRKLIRTGEDGFVTEEIAWDDFAPPGLGETNGPETLDPVHADLASTVQTRLEEVILEIAERLHARTGERAVALAGGVALNCVANSRLFEEGPFEDVWVQPAAGDAGTALGAACHVAAELGDRPLPMRTAALGRGWDDDEVESWLDHAGVGHVRCDDIAAEVADVLASDGIVAWFQGRSEFGPRALGHRSLLANPTNADNLRRLNDVKGREQFRPVAPMVLSERAKDVFDAGPFPSPYMLFTHRVRTTWLDRIPAVVHVDGTSRIQTVDRASEPLVHRMLSCFEERTGVPVVVNTSLNTAGRPMVDDPRDALECFGSAPVDALAIGSHLVRRADLFAR
jgi:carbamoyltransferase